MIAWKWIKEIFRKRDVQTITWEEAREIFQKEHPELTVTLVGDYSEQYYIIEAYEDPDAEEFDPFYYVDKENGDIYMDIPNYEYDLNQFYDSITKNVYYQMP